MNLFGLKYLIAVSEHESFTKAAERLYVTQPTLSRQIADLEREFGVQLFVRGKQSISLTDAGRICLEEAREIVFRSERLIEKLKQAKGNVCGSLSIGYLGFIEYELLGTAVRNISQKYPNLDLTLASGTLAELNYFLENKKYDVIFTVAAGLQTLPGVEWTKVAKNELQIIVPANHVLATKDSVKIGDLREEHFVMLERSVSPLTVDSEIDLCLANGFSPNVVYYAHDAQIVLLMVASGKGVAFLSSRLNRQQTEGVKFRRFREPCGPILAHFGHLRPRNRAG